MYIVKDQTGTHFFQHYGMFSDYLVLTHNQAPGAFGCLFCTIYDNYADGPPVDDLGTLEDETIPN